MHRRTEKLQVIWYESCAYSPFSFGDLLNTSIMSVKHDPFVQYSNHMIHLHVSEFDEIDNILKK